MRGVGWGPWPPGQIKCEDLLEFPPNLADYFKPLSVHPFKLRAISHYQELELKVTGGFSKAWRGPWGDAPLIMVEIGGNRARP